MSELKAIFFSWVLFWAMIGALVLVVVGVVHDRPGGELVPLVFIAAGCGIGANVIVNRFKE